MEGEKRKTKKDDGIRAKMIEIERKLCDSVEMFVFVSKCE